MTLLASDDFCERKRGSEFDFKTGKALCESLLLSICILSFLGR